MRHRFAQPLRGKRSAHLIAQCGWLRKVAREVASGQRWRDAVVSVETRHLFSNVGLKLQIAPPWRDHCDQALPLRSAHRSLARDWNTRRPLCLGHVDRNAREKLRLLGVRNAHTDQLAYTLRTEGEFTRLADRFRITVELTATDRAARPCRDKSRNLIRCEWRKVELLAALKAVRRLRAETVSLCAASNRCWGEDRALNDHALRGGGNLTRGASHHASEGECGTLIGNHKVARIKRSLNMVERLKLLLRLRQANLDPRANSGSIKRVGRLPEFEHDVVGRVHHVGDGAETRRLQAHLDRIWGCGNGDAIHNAQHHAWCKGRVGNGELQAIPHLTRAFSNLSRGVLHR